MRTGRPTAYSKALAEKICKKIATSERGLHAICRLKGMPSVSTVMRWLTEEDKKDFQELYARAKEAQADYMVEQILKIADDSSNDTVYTDKGEAENREWLNRSRLRVDSRKWLASKLLPKKYGDKLEIDANVNNTGSVVAYLPENGRDK